MLRRAVLAAALCAAACNDSNCNTSSVDLSAICIPETAAPGFTLDIDVRELCGRGCSGVPSCSAIFRNAQVTIETEQEVCTETLSAACVGAPCLQRVIRCQLPALAAGDYVIAAPGGLSRILHVAPGGSASCRFIPPAGY